MDRHDPNQWTREFVSENKDFCIRAIKENNDKVSAFLKEGEHKLAIVGLDRIMNGLITMTNAGYDYRSQVSSYSEIEASIMLFGNLEDAPEQNRIKTAKEALLDAMDFAKDETTKKAISEILDDINKGYNLSALASKYAGDFPDSEIKALENLNKKLDVCPTISPSLNATPSVNNTGRKKKPRWLVIIIIIIIVLGAITLLNAPKEATKQPALADPIQTTEATTESTTEATTEAITEATTEAVTEATTDENEAMLLNLSGKWIYKEITEGAPDPDGNIFPAILNEAYYSFYEDGRYSVGDARYEEASEDGQAYAEYIDGRYWICVGGGGREGSYTVNGNQITLVSDDSVQYGPSTTATITFTLDGDTLILNHNYGSTVYKRTNP